MLFSNDFDFLESKRLSLQIIEKNPGNDVEIPYYYYEIIEKKTRKSVGKISIRIGCNFHSYYNGHIGYEIDQEYRGHNYALEAAKLVLEIAKFHQMEFLYLTCEENNYASIKTIEKLGGKLIDEKKPPKSYFGYYEGSGRYKIYKLNLRDNMKHFMKLHNSPFEMIKSGEKTIELRLNDEKRQLIKKGDIIEFENTSDQTKKLLVEVLEIYKFPSFEELYKNLPLDKCGYSKEELTNAHYSDMESYYSKEKQKQYGVLGILVKVI